MSLSNSKYSSKRAVYNLFDFVADIGGIYGFLLLFGGAINGFIGPTLNAVYRAELLYMVSDVKDTPPKSNDNSKLQWLNSLHQLRLTFIQKLYLVLRCDKCSSS